MIAVIRGTILEKGLQSVIVDTGGVGYEVFLPDSVRASIGELGETVSLRTHLDVREDALCLYGFADRAQLELFRELIKVSGVGPRIAVALLSAYGTAELVAAIVSRDLKKVTAVSGLGKKTAQRIFLDLGDRLGRLGSFDSVGPTTVTPDGGVWEEAAAVLVSQGLKGSEVQTLLASVAEELPDSAGLAEIVTVALRMKGPRPVSPFAGRTEGPRRGARPGAKRRK